MNWRTYILPIAAICVIIYTLLSQWSSDKEHHAFFNDMRGFIQEGPRFTAEDGYSLCVAVKQLTEFAARHSSQPHLTELHCEKFLEKENGQENGQEQVGQL